MSYGQMYSYMVKQILPDDYPLTTWYWHIHHKEVVEENHSSICSRIWYILIGKPKRQWKTRFERLKRVENQTRVEELNATLCSYGISEEDYKKATEALKELHAEECGCNYYKDYGHDKPYQNILTREEEY